MTSKRGFLFFLFIVGVFLLISTLLVVGEFTSTGFDISGGGDGVSYAYDYDIAITDVFVSAPTVLSKGDKVYLNTTLKNLGKYEDSFQVFFTERQSGRIEKRNLDLRPGEESTFLFNITVSSGTRNYEIVVVSLSDENLENNRYNYSTYVTPKVDLGGEIISPKENQNLIAGTTNIRFNITNHGNDTFYNLNYSYYILDPENPLQPRIFNSSLASLAGKTSTIVNANPINLVTGKNYILMFVINNTGDEDSYNDIDTMYLNSRDSGVDLNVMTNITFGNSFFFGESKNVSFQVSNKGNVDSGNVLVKIYDYNPECIDDEESYSVDCRISLLKEFYIGSIPAFSTRSYSFIYESIREGYSMFEIEATPSVMDVYFLDNHQLFPILVKENGVDLVVGATSEQNLKEFIVGQKNNLTVRIGNIGDQQATNITVDLYELVYEYNDDEDYYEGEYKFQSSARVSALNPLSYTTVNLPFITDEQGYVTFRVNVSSVPDNDVDHSSNFNYYDARIIDDEYYFNLDNVEMYNYYDSGSTYYPVVGRNYTIRSVIENEGRAIDDVLVNFYLDGVLVESRNLGRIDYMGFKFFDFVTVPEIAGIYKTLKVEAKVGTDTQYYEYAFLPKSGGYINFEIKNSSGVYTRRYVKSNSFLERPSDSYGLITNEYTIEKSTSLEVNDPQEILLELIRYDNDSYVSAPNASVRYKMDLKGLGGELKLTSDYYDKITDRGRDFYYVFANELLQDTMSAEMYDFSMTVNSDILARSGIENLMGDYAVFYCTDFNFLTRGCNSEWNYLNYVYAEDIDFSEMYPVEWLSDAEILLPKIKRITSYDNPIHAEAFALSKSEGFDGYTTNIMWEYEDVISDFTLEKEFYGKIRFLDSVNISRFREHNGLLDTHVNISNKRIGINTDILNELSEKKAEITFKNVAFQSPKVLYNGGDCPSEVCGRYLFDNSRDVLILNVSHFSNFTVVDAPFCGNSVCSSGENCENCEFDCGSCAEEEFEEEEEESGNSGNNNAGPVVTNTCLPNWTCVWGECVNGVKERRCVDTKNCKTLVGKPSDKNESCGGSSCIDADGDGYGQGDCLGTDYDDNDANVQVKPIQEDPDYMIYIYIVAGVLLILIVAIILVIIFTDKNKKVFKSNDVPVVEDKENLPPVKKNAVDDYLSNLNKKDKK